MVVELVQRRQVSSASDSFDFPMIGGVTLIIGLDKRGHFPIRYLISKPSEAASNREQRQLQFHLSRGLAAAPQGDSAFRIDFALLHGGI
jgi:hypothetical protein